MISEGVTIVVGTVNSLFEELVFYVIGMDRWVASWILVGFSEKDFRCIGRLGGDTDFVTRVGAGASTTGDWTTTCRTERVVGDVRKDEGFWTLMLRVLFTSNFSGTTIFDLFSFVQWRSCDIPLVWISRNKKFKKGESQREFETSVFVISIINRHEHFLNFHWFSFLIPHL